MNGAGATEKCDHKRAQLIIIWPQGTYHVHVYDCIQEACEKHVTK